MKRVLACILAVFTILTFVGCGGVDSVILSTNNCEIVDGETFALTYNVVPENADTSDLVWKSADEKIATVGSDGIVMAQSVGQTSVYLTDGNKTFATCTVTVLRKKAYDLLNETERNFVDLVLRNINVFKNPDSVEIVDLAFVETDDPADSFWVVEISAQNGFGGTSKQIFVLDNVYGFHENEYILAVPYDVDYYRIDLINEAIGDER